MRSKFAEREYLFAPPREFAVYNPSDAEVVLAFDGETKIIPPNKNVVQVTSDKFAAHSCIDTDGNLVPGTLVIKDVPGPRGMCDGGRIGEWSAAECIRTCLGLDPTTGEGSSLWYKKGISIISTRPSPDEVEEVRADSNIRYSAWLIDWAKQVREEVEVRATRHRAVGLTYTMTPKEHMELAKADAILAAAEVKMRSDAMEAMGLPSAKEEDELDAFVSAKAKELASKKATTEVEREALAQILVNDAEFAKILRKAWWDKKKGKTPAAV